MRAKQKVLIRTSIYIGFILYYGPLLAQPSIGAEGFRVITESYTYDYNLPFNVITKEVKEFKTFTRHKISYSGTRETVGAYLAIPSKGEEPFPVVLLIDGMGGSKESWFKKGGWSNGLETTEALIKKGFAVFTIDAAMHGARFKEDGLFPKPLSLRKAGLMHTVRDMIILTVQDYMRGLDYLGTRKDVDTKKVGAYGLSMGGTVTFILTGLDDRIKTSVTGVAVVYGNAYSVTNAYNFTPRITDSPFLMLMGSSDSYYTSETATELFNSIGGNQNKLIIFDGGHKVPLSFVASIANWFQETLLE